MHSGPDGKLSRAKDPIVLFLHCRSSVHARQEVYIRSKKACNFLLDFTNEIAY
jgi:hypothetical protein